MGYSTSRNAHMLDGLELHTKHWQVEPFEVTQVASTLFDDAACFPAGTITFDCALLMRGIPLEWHRQEPLHVLERPVLDPTPVSMNGYE